MYVYKYNSLKRLIIKQSPGKLIKGKNLDVKGTLHAKISMPNLQV